MPGTSEQTFGWNPSHIGWQTVGSAPEENRFTMCRTRRGVYHSAVFEIKKEIPVRAFVGSDRFVKLLSKLGGVR
jgi:hypothetical protein